MTKQEFLSELVKALEGEVPQSVIREQVNFYSSYIDTQISCGKREEAVLEELGSPRLIARTIIDSTEAAAEDGAGFSGGYERSGSFGGASEEERREFERMERSAAWKAVMILILILLLLTCVLGTVFRFLFSPFGLIFILAALLYFWYISRYR